MSISMREAMKVPLRVFASLRSPVKQPRDVAEAQVLAQSLDALRTGRPEVAADILATGFIALEVQTPRGKDWKAAALRERRDEGSATLTGD